MDDDTKAEIADWFTGPVKNFDKIWKILDRAGEHKVEIAFDQDGKRRAIILVQGEANVKRASALLEDL